MFLKKTILIIWSVIIATFQLNAQYSGIEIYTGLGVPLYGEKSFPEKNFDGANVEACPPLSRPGYYTKGSPSFLIGSTTGYNIGSFTIKAGISYQYYQTHMWANPDSAIKYAVPLCPDPYLNFVNEYHTFNLPIGLGFQINKLELVFLYGLPIFSHLRGYTTRLSGAEVPANFSNAFFYRRVNHNYFYQLDVAYNFTELFGLGFTYLFNSERKLNHLNLVLKIKIAS